MGRGLSARERQLLDLLEAEERVVFTTAEALDLWEGSQASASMALSRLVQKGWLQRLKRGAYMVIPLGSGTRTPSIAKAWQVASVLFDPCMISGWSAAEHWGLTDQIFNAISLVTTKSQRSKDQRVGGIRFRVRVLPRERFFGSVRIWIGSSVVNVADQHRTLIDILDSPQFGGGGRHMLDVVRAYWLSKDHDIYKLFEYAIRYGRGTVFKRLGLTADAYSSLSRTWLDRIHNHCTKGTSLLDPDSPPTGRVVSKWNIKVNIPLAERDTAS